MVIDDILEIQAQLDKANAPVEDRSVYYKASDERLYLIPSLTTPEWVIDEFSRKLEELNSIKSFIIAEGGYEGTTSK